MTYKQKLCSRIIEKMEWWREAQWADYIDPRTKDDVITVMENVVDGIANHRQTAYPESISAELKPCPFCGADGDDIEPRMIYPHPFSKSGVYISCRKCGAGIFDTNPSHCLNDVKKAWNRRAERRQDGAV